MERTALPATRPARLDGGCQREGGQRPARRPRRGALASSREVAALPAPACRDAAAARIAGIAVPGKDADPCCRAIRSPCTG